MIDRRAGVRAAAGLLIAAGGPLIAAPAWAGGGTGDKVTLCHRTDANNNPYVSITIDPDAVFRQGHDGHTGPIWNPSLKSQGQKWGDIIPPFDYTVKSGHQTETRHYDGMNWTAEGQAIQSSGCETSQPPPSESPSSTPTQTATETPTQTPSASSSPSQSPSETPSSSPSQTPSETGSPSSSETPSLIPTFIPSVLPTSSTLSPSPSPSQSSSPTMSPTGSPSPSTTVLPTKSVRPPTPPVPPTQPPKPPLPFTGFPAWPLSVIGFGFVAGGIGILRRFAR